MAPLTKLAAETGKSKGSNRKKVPWHWDKEHQDAFDEAKRMVIEEAELASPTGSYHFICILMLVIAN